MIKIQNELQDIHNQYGISEVANYKIQLLCERYAKEYHENHIKDVKNISKKVDEIAQTYHDKICGGGLTMEGQICKCCEKDVLTTTKIEHDSKDYSKDLDVCLDCYQIIHSWWNNYKFGKIAPI